jgi:hypothetical protein
MYREWKKIEFPRVLLCEFGNNKTERKTGRIVGGEEWQKKV